MLRSVSGEKILGSRGGGGDESRVPHLSNMGGRVIRSKQEMSSKTGRLLDKTNGKVKPGEGED